MTRIFPGLLRDLYEFDPILLTWTEHKPNSVIGDFPIGRSSFGFTSANDRLFVFGGWSVSGMSDCQSTPFPRLLIPTSFISSNSLKLLGLKLHYLLIFLLLQYQVCLMICICTIPCCSVGRSCLWRVRFPCQGATRVLHLLLAVYFCSEAAPALVPTALVPPLPTSPIL